METARRFATLDDALAGSDAPAELLASLALIDVPYVSFDGGAHVGQLVIHRDLAEEVRGIFKELRGLAFPLGNVTPIAAYGWNDEASMADNNTSAFNYRRILATDTLSNHSSGRAIDLNPRQNPYSARDGRVYPAGATHDPNVRGTIAAGSEVVRAFKRYGWEWLGERKEYPDYQHFQRL